MLKKVIGATCALLFLTLAAAGGYLYYRLKTAIPSYEGELVLDILEAPVQIELDEWGIPHIVAQSELDARRALGYLMARERLFQMDLYRLAAKGELASLVGADALVLDRLYRVLGLRRTSEKWLEDKVVTGELLEVMNAYFSGVNAFLKEGNLPFEYLLLGRTPEEFGPVDALSFVGYMAYSFSVSAKQDLLLPQLEAKFGAKRVESLRGESSTDNRHLNAQIPYNQKVISHLSNIEQWHERLGRIEGSNAWVLSGDRTESGFPILASDPHISFTLPNLWFEAYLEFPRKNETVKEYGHFLPLIGVPVMAHNQHFGWGLTMSFIDDMDFYQEKFNEDRTQVLYKNEWVDISKVTETIKVKGEEEVVLEIPVTPHGPLVDHVFETKDVSAWWAFTDQDNRAIEAFFDMGRARNHGEFSQAIAKGGAPGMNVLYADREGHIGWWMFGKVPLRGYGVRADFMGRGDDGGHDILGALPFAAKPFMLDPPTGVIVSANQRPLRSSPSIVGDYQSMDRFNTISTLLEDKERWSVSELKGVQTANFNIEEEWKRGILLSDMAKVKGTISRVHLLEEVKKWDGISDSESLGALLFQHWIFLLERELLDELTEEEFLGFCRINAEIKAIGRLLQRSDDPWWDVAITKDVIEKREDVVLLAWNEMIRDLESELGSDESDWQWGKLHQIPFAHPLAIGVVLKELLTYGPYPASGAFNNVNNLRRIGCGEGHTIRAGPSTRRLVDFAHPEESLGVLPLGNSGHLLSPYFMNQRELFLKGEYRPQVMKVKNAVKRLVLRPK